MGVIDQWETYLQQNNQRNTTIKPTQGPAGFSENEES